MLILSFWLTYIPFHLFIYIFKICNFFYNVKINVQKYFLKKIKFHLPLAQKRFKMLLIAPPHFFLFLLRPTLKKIEGDGGSSEGFLHVSKAYNLNFPPFFLTRVESNFIVIRWPRIKDRPQTQILCFYICENWGLKRFNWLGQLKKNTYSPQQSCHFKSKDMQITSKEVLHKMLKGQGGGGEREEGR